MHVIGTRREVEALLPGVDGAATVPRSGGRPPGASVRGEGLKRGGGGKFNAPINIPVQLSRGCCRSWRKKKRVFGGNYCCVLPASSLCTVVRRRCTSNEDMHEENSDALHSCKKQNKKGIGEVQSVPSLPVSMYVNTRWGTYADTRRVFVIAPNHLSDQSPLSLRDTPCRCVPAPSA